MFLFVYDLKNINLTFYSFLTFSILKLNLKLVWYFNNERFFTFLKALIEIKYLKVIT